MKIGGSGHALPRDVMIAITAGLCVLLATPGFSGPEAEGSPTPTLVASSERSAGQLIVLKDIVQVPTVRPVLAPSAPATFTQAGSFRPVTHAGVPQPNLPQKRAWLALTILQHGTAAFDAWSTRESVTSGNGKELNPLMKPFAGSGAIYGAIQVAPLVTDWWARRLQRSQHPTLRRLWWVPQAASSVGFTFSGVNNLRIASRR